jgi:hypothetical protein
MKSKWSCNLSASYKRVLFFGIVVSFCAAGLSQKAIAGNAPAWMQAVLTVPLPAHDEKTKAVLLFSDEVVTVQSESKVKTVVRQAYKILRPEGREYGYVVVPFHPGLKITSLHGWCIPDQGKHYEVKDKDAIEISLPKIEGSELINDTRDKILQIPAADPGNVIGYEYVEEEQPYVLQDTWYFQAGIPVHEAHYTLQLPAGWEYRTTFLNAVELRPTQSGNQWQWSISDVKALKAEEQMPPWSGVAGQMIVSYFPAGGSVPGKNFSDWRQMGSWYSQLTQGRVDPNAETTHKVAELTATATTPLDKMRAIAKFLQSDVRYVAIELGIGGWQPHPAQEVLAHGYGDCKDKATLMRSMLQEIGIESYHVVINTHRGSVTPDVPAHLGAFNHAIVAIKLPAGLGDPSLHATMQHPKLGTLLFFDPTNEITPFGQIGGYLQANYGLLVGPEGGELVQLPKQPGEMNSIRRTGKLQLTAEGTLTGDFEEIRVGDRAAEQRAALRSVTNDAERIKPIEALLSQSLSTFQITKASVANFHETSLPFQYRYSIVAAYYAKKAGDLVLVRPRIVGNKASAILETKEPRKLPVEFPGPSLDTDSFEITLPPGYEVDELPPPVNVDYTFAAYHSKTEAIGRVLRYSRTMEIKELSVPISKMEELKNLYRVIAADERDTAALKSEASK